MAAWTPANLGSSLKGWYRGDTLTGANGDSVPTWPDDSSFANNLTAWVAAPPKLATSVQNGRNAIQFNNDSYWYANMGLFTGTISEASLFFVAKANTGANGGLFGAWGGGGSGWGAYPWAGDNITMESNFLSSTAKGWTSTGLFDWHIGSYQSKAGDWRYAKNGADVYTTGTNTVAKPAGPMVGFGGGNGWTGYLGEWLFVSSFLTTQQRQQVEGYLAHKWGMTANLAADHPYKIDAPMAPVDTPATYRPGLGIGLGLRL